MNDSSSLASLSNFLFSGLGALTVLFMAGLVAFLWSDELKRRWQQRVERKKWEYWNGPSARQKAPIKRGEKPTKR